MGHIKRVTATFVRPDDDTTYTIGDEVSDDATEPTPLVFENVARNPGWGGRVLGATLLQEGASDLECTLWLFTSAPSMEGNNEPAAIAAEDAPNFVARVVFDTPVDMTGSTVNVGKLDNVVGAPFQCAAGSTSLYGVVQADSAYDPSDAETLQFDLYIDVC